MVITITEEVDSVIINIAEEEAVVAEEADEEVVAGLVHSNPPTFHKMMHGSSPAQMARD